MIAAGNVDLAIARLRRDRRIGLTMIELTVVLAILGLLAALLAPAIQAVRESGRELICQNHQRQLALATLSYHNDYDALPPSGYFSSNVAMSLFPYLEQPPVDVCVVAGMTSLEHLECPSDGEISGQMRPLSYTFNVSPGVNSGWLEEGPYFLPRGGVRRLRDVTDGTGHTACVSEFTAWRLGGAPTEAAANPMRHSWEVVVPPLEVAPADPDYHDRRREQTEASIADCHSDLFRRPQTGVGGVAFHAWDRNSWTGYSHWLPPNLPRCKSTDSGTDTPFLRFSEGARSMHPGGVGVAFLDGRRIFVNESVARSVWRAAGTCNGGETESLRF